MRKASIGALLCTMALSVAAAETPARPTGLLKNGNFKQAEGERAVAWTPYDVGGYRHAPGVGRAAGDAILCENADDTMASGASQDVALHQKVATPLVVSGWSKAADVSGAEDSFYSLYVDVAYVDGTKLSGRAATFPTGSHDWKKAEVVIEPEKPIASLSVYCLFRNHSGRVWFSDVSMNVKRAKK